MDNSSLFLVRPSKTFEDEILEYKQEHFDFGDKQEHFDFGDKQVHGSCGLAFYDNFDEWLNLVLSIAKDKLRNGVHTTTYFTRRKEDNRLIGCIKIHHSLTATLENGGHIAYGIRPSERNKGYGKTQLQLILGVARDLNLRKVMIVCNKDNIASARTAISCGGILTDEVVEEGVLQQHYWIDL